jgi:hypothetical protein
LNSLLIFSFIVVFILFSWCLDLTPMKESITAFWNCAGQLTSLGSLCIITTACQSLVANLSKVFFFFFFNKLPTKSIPPAPMLSTELEPGVSFLLSSSPYPICLSPPRNQTSLLFFPREKRSFFSLKTRLGY